MTVHPVPAPTSTKAELKRSNNEGGSSQKLILFKRGKAINVRLLCHRAPEIV
jgi:hypothetical protein